MDNWEDWLWESVSWDEYVPRWKAVKHTVELGLVPQFSQKGYVFICSPNKLTERILTGLYISRGKHSGDIPWLFGRDRTAGTEEEKAHYDHVLNPEFWEAFWREWGHWSDVDSTTERGIHRQIDIQEYCWTQIDLVYSPQTNVLDELLHGTDDDEYGAAATGGGRGAPRIDDIYLREAAESNQWGGYRR